MKTRMFLLSLITLFCLSTATAQHHRKKHRHKHHHSKHNYGKHSLLSYVFNAGHNHNRHTHYNYYPEEYLRTDYDSYDRYYDRMSRRDQRCLRDLINKLEERKRCAWEDGYITDREDRRIYDVEQDIEDLLDKYRRSNRYNNRGSGYSNPRCR